MFKRLGRRDRIALGIAVAATALFTLFDFGVFPLLDRLGMSAEAAQQKEVELQQDQRLLAEAKLDTTHFTAAQDHLKQLEAGLLESALPYVATADWQRQVRQVADSKGIQLGSSEFLRVQQLGAGYSLVTGRVEFNCRLDQLVDFLVALASSPKLLSATSLVVSPFQGDRQGKLNVQLTIGAAARTLKPEKDEATARR
jgi:hypothetical protein